MATPPPRSTSGPWSPPIHQSAAWPFDIAATAVELFESLPNEFRFDELVDQSRALGHSPERVAEHLRAYQRFEMVDIADDVLRKTGQTPYF